MTGLAGGLWPFAPDWGFMAANELRNLGLETMPEGDNQIRKHRHPGSGRRGTGFFPKGRQVDPVALDEVRALLGDRPRRRDLLIEHLHLIQDKYHALSAAHLAALAQEMRL